MQTFKGLLLGVFASTVAALGGATASHAQSALPQFQCSGAVYQVQSGQLRIFDPITSSYQNIGSNQGSYNGAGFNVLDNYVYGSQGNNLIRIGADGNKEVVFNLGFGSFSGDVDLSNNFWLRRNNLSYRRINIATGDVTTVNFTGPNNGVADVYYYQDGGQEFLAGFTRNTQHRYNITTGVKTNVAVSGLTSNGGYGAAWTDRNGRVFTFNNNTGLLYEIFGASSANPTASVVAQGDPSGNNDGFSCALAPFPNLAPVAFDDVFATPVNVPVSGNVIDDNGNGMDNDPDGTPVTVTDAPVTGPSNGSVVVNPDGSFVYTPDTNFIGTDIFTYEITDEGGLSATATVTITVTGTIDFDLDKSVAVAGPNPVTTPGQVLTFTVTAENTGDVPLTNVQIVDTGPDNVVRLLSGQVETGAASNVLGQLDIAETWTFTYDYSVTQDDLDAGGPLNNRVSATTDETGPSAKTDDTSTPVSQTPAFTISKGVDVATLTGPGLLTYDIEVENTGNVSLTGVSLTDNLAQSGNGLTLTSGPTLSGDLDDDGILDVGETWTYAATFDATQAEIDDTGDIVNTAEFATNEAGTFSDTATTTIDDTPSLTIDKRVNESLISAPDTLVYEIEVENTGNVSLTGVSLLDDLRQNGVPLTLTTGPALSGDADNDDEIDVGETWLYTATFAATQAQIDDGADIVNLATISANEVADASDTVTTNIDRQPSFSLTKNVDMASLDAPGTLTYAIVLQNTGNTTLTGITPVDELSQGAATLALTSGLTLSGDADNDGDLDVGETWIYAATFDALQAQINDGGDIVNEITINPAEAPSQSAAATTTISQVDGLDLTKAVAAGQPTSFSAVGDTIDFTFVVTNPGNTTRTGPITITDDQIPGPLVCQAGDLAPGASVSCTFTWTAEQADLNAGSVTNTATASDGGGFVSGAQQATVSAVQDPQIAIDKAIVSSPANFQPGGVLNYSYVITNPGNVTITDALVVNDNLTPVNCDPLPVGGLLPLNGGVPGPTTSVACTGTYTITANDVDLGSVVNVVTVDTSFDGTPLQAQDDAIFPTDSIPVIGLAKATVPADVTVSTVGETVTYAYTVTNQQPPLGIGVALTQEIFVTDDRLPAPFVCYDPATDGGPLLVGQSHTCTATYSVTQDDLDAEEIVNTATASTIFRPLNNPVDLISAPATATVVAIGTPAVSLVKNITGGPDPADVGDQIFYEIIATNDGNQTLSNVTIADPLLGTLACDVPAPVTLLPTEALTCTGNYIIAQADLDGQTVGDNTTAVLTNTANVAANDPQGEALAPVEAEADQNLEEAAPSISIAKALFPDPAADPAFMNVGDALQFQMTVENTGNMTVNDISVTDSLVAGTCDIGTLAPGATDTTCLFEYIVTQLDIDAGEVLNTGTATGQPADAAADALDVSDDLIAPGPSFAPSLTVEKSSSLDLGIDGVASVGDLITYTITVINTGNVTIRDTAVIDPLVGPVSYLPADDPDLDQDIDSLAPGERAVVTATYPLTQIDIDAGSVSNSATATGQDPSGAPVTDTSDSDDPNAGPGDDAPTLTDIPRVTGVDVTKAASDTTDVVAGTDVTYTYTVTNTGNVTLSNVTLSDAHVSASGTSNLAISPNGGVVASLLPGASATLSATYTVTQEDIDVNAPLTNTVSATGQGPSGTTPPTDTADEEVDLDDQVPGLEVLKTVRSTTGLDAGDTIVFEVSVENTGNVTLGEPTLSDTLRRADASLVFPAPTPVFESGDGGQSGSLDVGETWIYTVTYVLTQTDVDAGGVNNSVAVQVTSPTTTISDISDNGTGDGDDPTPVLIPASPGLETIKTITSAPVDVGQTVSFEITVENTGNVTLSDVALVSDTLTRADGTGLTLASGPSFFGASLSSPEGTLQTGEVATYVASYVLTQDDIDAGGIANTATASGTPPFGAPVTDVSDDDGAGDDPTVLTIPADPQIAFDKRLALGSGPSFDMEGDVLDFEFEITNEGNVTLSGPYAISDPLITDAGGAVSCPTSDLAPNASLVCTGSYTVTQADVDAGGITNAATATVGDAPSVSDDIDVPAIQNPELLLEKTAPSIEPADFVTGLVVTYTFTATNTGNTTLTAPITISDELFSPADYVCPAFPPTGLAPDQTYVCTADYTVTAEDVQLAVIVNNATGSSGDIDSNVATETVPNNGTPVLDIDKSIVRANEPDGSDSGGLTFDEAGDQLVYEFTVTNNGNFAFARDIEIFDTLFDDPITCFAPSAADPELAAGEVVTCNATYIVNQEDLDAGEVLNEAFARTEFGVIPTIVLSDPDEVTVVADLNPAFELEKLVDAASFTSVGDVLSYDLTVTNTGNQTLTNVVVSDDLLPGLVCEIDTLVVGAELTCSDTYVVTQADIDAGGVTNMAAVTGLDPGGNALPEGQASVTSTGPMDPGTMTLQKIATPNPFGPAGSAVSYVFEVTNTSIVTLSNITVSDPIPGFAVPFTCTIPTLAPGAVDMTSCLVTTTVSQDDVDAGEIVNTATAEATDPFGNDVAASDTITVPGPAQVPALEVTKLAEVPATTLGTSVTFTALVENTGNVTLTPIALSDTMLRNDGTPISLTSPFAFVSGDDNLDGDLTPGEAWVYSGAYTITQADINAGGFSNSLEVTGFAPDGSPVRDDSDDGNDADGNTTDDATEVPITTDPVLDVTKTISQTASAVGETVVFEIAAANRGNVDILNAVPSDTLTRVDGTDLSAQITGPTRTTNPNDNGDAILDPGEIWTWDVTYVLTQADLDAGGIDNSATVSGTDTGGNEVADVSDNGEDGDGNTTNDQTGLAFAPQPALEVTKSVTEIGVAAGEVVGFEVLVENTGNVTLSGINLTDTMTNGAGDVVGPLNVSVTGLTAGGLAPGDVATYTVLHTLTQADIDSGSLSNTATADGMTPGGIGISDVSDDGIDDDGNVVDDPTLAVIPQTPSMEATKEAGVPLRIAPNLFEVVFTMTIENTGNVTLTDLVAEDDLSGVIPPATLEGVDTPVVDGFDVGSANAGYDGIVDISLLTAGAELAPGSIGTIELTVRYDTSNGFPGGENTLVVEAAEVAGTVSASASIIAGDVPDILASKSASPSTAILGDTITYALRFENRLATAEDGVSFVDVLPEGMVFTPGTALVNGSATPEPVLSGSVLRWGAFTLAPGEVFEITYQARLVGGESGEYINSAYAVGPDGARISNVATAVVVRRPETVFDCADIIGKVFDDKNLNGYQDGKPSSSVGEPGLPNVRFSTANGTLITTDEFGRFNVPCAALPADIGSNFFLKLDTRTLPSGYFVTTENPRVVRVTPGRVSKLNFGAALGTLVELDLMAPAFKGEAPNAALTAYVTDLVKQIEKTPSIIRLTYYRQGEDQETASDRLAALEKVIRKAWKGQRRYKLTIERLIYRVQ